ncbi:MAG: hypothetical protein WC393_01105 [Candidatus Nanoarchaeia archaeon]|jgi:hypothetical protein
MVINIKDVYNDANKNIKENIIGEYINTPTIRLVLVQARDLERILNPNERTISLRHCLINKYIIQQKSKYKITPEGVKALGIIEEYIKNR